MAYRSYTSADYRDQAWMMDCLMYGYIPLEFRDSLSTDNAADVINASSCPQEAESGAAPSSPRRHLTLTLLLTLCLGVVGFTTVKTMAQIGEVLPLHGQNVVSDLGVLNQRKY